jgi:thiamine biosynthesis protein ThiI
MSTVLILHYHEIWLKGGNKRFFLSRLMTAVRDSTADLPVGAPEYFHDRILVEPHEESAASETLERLKRVFGIAYVAMAHESPPELEAMSQLASQLVREKNPSTFAVRAKVADRSLGLTSLEIERALGRAILDDARGRGAELRVNLGRPELTCHVEIVRGRAFLYVERAEGAGGLPAATGGRLMALLSGGFDSSVAAYKMMRRGAHLSFAHFYAPPSPAKGSSLPVVEEIVRTLTPYQFSSRLFLIPFDPIQREIVAAADQSFRLLLYRRMMARIARELARVERGLGLVTGDSVSQVASQTLHNLAAMDRGFDFPVYRPLAGDDKEEILALARRIGTYKISCEPFEDCCPRFMPKSPAIHARPEDLEHAESALDLDRLVTMGLGAAECRDYRYENGQVIVREAAPRRLQKMLEARRGVPESAALPPRPADR